MTQLTILVHASLYALGQSTGAALIAMGLVDHTTALGLGLAHVLSVLPDGPLEEASATVAREYAVVFAGRVVPAYLARRVVENSTCKHSKKKKTNIKLIIIRVNFYLYIIICCVA